MTIKFLQNKLTKDELLNFATENQLIKKQTQKEDSQTHQNQENEQKNFE